ISLPQSRSSREKFRSGPRAGIDSHAKRPGPTPFHISSERYRSALMAWSEDIRLSTLSRLYQPGGGDHVGSLSSISSRAFWSRAVTAVSLAHWPGVARL